MIELTSGVPGSGKTLSTVERLAKLQARWEAHSDESRPVFVLGIPDLALPHSPVPLKSVQVSKAGAPMLVPDWDEMPDGSLVIIDEAQGCFPPRSSMSTPPEHVAWLNTHRHRGFDIWVSTQHPKLIDGSVRALVGRHQHFRRLFGGQRAVIYEWDSCSDSLAGTASSVKSYYSYPRQAFKWYKSAEIHTKQKFKLPMWIYIPFAGVLLGLYFVPKAYGVLTNGMSGKSIKVEENPKPSESIKKLFLQQAGFLLLRLLYLRSSLVRPLWCLSLHLPLRLCLQLPVSRLRRSANAITSRAYTSKLPTFSVAVPLPRTLILPICNQIKNPPKRALLSMFIGIKPPTIPAASRSCRSSRPPCPGAFARSYYRRVRLIPCVPLNSGAS